MGRFYSYQCLLAGDAVLCPLVGRSAFLGMIISPADMVAMGNLEEDSQNFHFIMIFILTKLQYCIFLQIVYITALPHCSNCLLCLMLVTPMVLYESEPFEAVCVCQILTKEKAVYK